MRENIALLHLFFDKDQADAVRTEKIAKWLYESGRKPIIITYKNSRIRKSKYYSIYFLKFPPTPKLLAPFILNIELLYVIKKLNIKLLYLFLIGSATASLLVKPLFRSSIAMMYDLQGLTVEEVDSIWKDKPYLIDIIKIIFGVIETRIIKTCNCISFHNSILRTYYKLKYKGDFKKSVILPNIPTLITSTPAPTLQKEIEDFIKNRNCIAYIGRDQKWQGVDGLLNALNTYNHPNLCFVIIGFDVKKYGTFKNELVFNKENLPKEVINSLLPIFDCGIIPRRPDLVTMVAAPTKFFEYLGAGMIILSSDVGEAGQLIKKYNLGKILDFNNINETFNWIANMTKEEIISRKNHNLKIFDEIFDEKTIIENLKNLLIDLI